MEVVLDNFVCLCEAAGGGDVFKGGQGAETAE